MIEIKIQASMELKNFMFYKSHIISEMYQKK